MLYLITAFGKRKKSSNLDSEDDRYKRYILTDEFEEAERIYHEVIKEYKHVRLKECYKEDNDCNETIAFYDEEVKDE